jgi:hypothetical protein
MKFYVHTNHYLTCVNIEAVTFCEWHPSLPAVWAMQVRESCYVINGGCRHRRVTCVLQLHVRRHCPCKWNYGRRLESTQGEAVKPGSTRREMRRASNEDDTCSVTMGTPIMRHSTLVMVPQYGHESSMISMSLYMLQ